MSYTDVLSARLRRQQRQQLDTKYQADLDKPARERAEAEEDFRGGTRSLYVEAMEKLRDLPQQLAAAGLWGGSGEERGQAIRRDYISALRELEKAWDRKRQSLDDTELRTRTRWREEVEEWRLKDAIAAKRAAAGGRTARSGGKAGGQGTAAGRSDGQPADPSDLFTDPEEIYAYLTMTQNRQFIR